MQQILITGFEPFGGERVNPSERAARGLVEAGIPGASATLLVLPVVRYRCIDLVVDVIERDRPDVIMMLGEAGGRMQLTPERVSVNIDDFRRPDNAGGTAAGALIVPGGPDAYFATLPVAAMVRAIQAAGVPAAVSNSAGTYLCNHLSYGVLHHIAARHLPVLAGFVHLPYLPEQAATKESATPSMALDTVLLGLRAALAAIQDAQRPLLTVAEPATR